MLKKFEELAIPSMEIDEAYMKGLNLYKEELKLVSEQYHSCSGLPPVVWDFPPLAGKSIMHSVCVCK